MALRQLLEAHREQIDVIAIMTSGRDLAGRVHESLGKLDATRQNTLIEFYPITQKRFHPEGVELGLKNKKKFDYARRNGYVSPDVDYETFRNNAALRFIGQIKPENVLLLAEDLIYTGTTLKSTLFDLESLGFDREKVYIYEDKNPMIWRCETGRILRPNWESLGTNGNVEGRTVWNFVYGEDPEPF